MAILTGITLAGLTAGSAQAAAARTVQIQARTPAPPHASPDLAAVTEAKRAGHPVTVSAATSEVSRTVANSDGTLTTTTHVLPVRVKLHGRWTPVNASLHRGPSGSWSPAATPSGLTFSGGGRGPLATLTSPAGGILGIRFPVSLPVPVIAGNTATYRAVLPGVDLRLVASQLGGLSETLIVRDARAAASQALRQLRMGLSATRLTVTTGAAGNLAMTGLRGRAEFSSPPPAMWDSAHGSAQGQHAAGSRAASGMAASASGPGQRSRTAPARFAVTAGALALHPSMRLLSPAASYPVYINATVTPDTFTSGSDSSQSSQNGFVETQQACPAYTNWNVSFQYGNAVGYQNYAPCEGDYNTYYQLDVTNLDPSMQVQSATLQTWEKYSADWTCADKWPLNQYSLGKSSYINQNTDWNNQPSLGSPTSTDQVKTASNPNSSCSNQEADFDVTNAMANAASGGWSTWTFALTGNTTNALGFMRVGDNPDVNTVFDLVPNVPTSTVTSPAAHDSPGGNTDNGCNSGGPYGWIGKTDLGSGSNLDLDAHVQANITGEDVRAKYNLWDTQDNGATIASPESGWIAGSGTAITPTGVALQDGHRYGWQAAANVRGIPEGSDNGYTSAYAQGCHFQVDLTAPQVPGVSSTTFPPSGGTTSNGQPGSFSFTSSDPVPPSGCSPAPCLASGVYEFEYSLNSQTIPAGGFTSDTATHGFVLATGNGNGSPTAATLSNFTVGDWGTNTLYVEVLDTAGNASTETAYSFYVPWNTSQGVVPGDINGDGQPDLLATTTAGGLDLYPGPLGSSLPSPVNASGTNQSPDGSSDWNSYLITHRGSMSHQGYDDLFALKPGSPNLYLYVNNPANQGQDPFGSTANVTTISSHPSCAATADNATNCSSYPAGNWSGVTQILAPGDAWAGAPAGSGITADNGQPSLITVENGQLWLYQGTNSDSLANPIQLGSAGWANMTLIAPGQVNGQLTLWARDNTTGQIYSYPITLDANNLPTLNPTAAGTPIPAEGAGSTGILLPGITLPAASYPTIASTGDSTATAGPSLYAIDTSGNVWDYPGTPGGTPSTTPVNIGTTSGLTQIS